jgi:hypothetical protein
MARWCYEFNTIEGSGGTRCTVAGKAIAAAQRGRSPFVRALNTREKSRDSRIYAIERSNALHPNVAAYPRVSNARYRRSNRFSSYARAPRDARRDARVGATRQLAHRAVAADAETSIRCRSGER